MTKILMTANSSWYLANFRSGLIRAMRARGYSVTILAPHDAYADRLRELGCDVIPLEMDNKGTSPFRDWRLFMTFQRQLHRLKPDAVFSFTVKNNVYCGLAARWAKIPFLPTVSGLGTAFVKQSWLTRVVTVLSRVAFRHLRIVFFQNSDDSDLFIAHGIVERRSCVSVPGSGVDLAAFALAPLPSQEITVFLLIARMLWDKGIAEYVEAARKLRSEGFPVRFQLLGFLGVENRTAIDKVTMDGWLAEGIVEYLGATDDVRPFIRNADCVVLPSYREGTPRSLLEAAAMGRPIITTDTPGCRNVVEDGLTGFLCRPKDTDSLRFAVMRFLALDPAQRSKMGQDGRSKIEREYDENIVIESYFEALNLTLF